MGRGRGKGKKNSKKGYSNPQSISRGIEKRAATEYKHQIWKTSLNISPVPTIAPTHDFLPPYPNVPALTSAVPFSATYSWDIVQGERLVSGDQLCGYIFMCNGKTKPDCYRHRVMGLPASRIEVVQKIRPDMKLFLFDFDLKILYGIYIAVSNGEMALEPNAFGGRFPAQVRFAIFKDCLPLPESAFKHVTKDNLQGGHKFKQELNGKQVADLISLFRPVAAPPPPSVASFVQTAMLPTEINPRQAEVQSRPDAELSTSYDQYLAGMHLVQPGQERLPHYVLRTFSSFSHAPHALTTKAQSLHLLPVGAQPIPEPATAYQAYHPQNLTFPPKDPYSRYHPLPRDNEGLATTDIIAQTQAAAPSQCSAPSGGDTQLPSSSLTAAYWAAVASEGPKSVDPATCAAPTPQPNQENRDTQVLLQPNGYHLSRAPSHGPLHLPSSSLVVDYGASAASEDPNQVYPGLSHSQAWTSTGSAPSYAAVPWSHNVVLATNHPQEQSRVQVANLPVALSYEPAYLSFSSAAATYWTAVASQDPNQEASRPHHRVALENTGQHLAALQ